MFVNWTNLTFNNQGHSDITKVLSNWTAYVGNIAARRIFSIIKYKGPKSVSKLINKMIGWIPDEIDIPGTDLYL